MEKRSNTWESWHRKKVEPRKVSRICDIDEQFTMIENTTSIQEKPNHCIIEIGPADGTLCKYIITKYDNRIDNYTLIDDVSMLDICKNNLLEFDNITYVSIDDIETVNTELYTIFISNHCLAETTQSYRKYIYDNIISKSQEVFILDDTSTGKHFNTDGNYKNELTESLNKLFDNVTISDGHKYSMKTQKLFYANNRK